MTLLYLLAQRVCQRQIAKGTIVQAGQTCQQRSVQGPACVLCTHFQHLQTCHRRLDGIEQFAMQAAVVVTGAHKNAVGGEVAHAAVYLPLLGIVHMRLGIHIHAHCLQAAGNGGQGVARVDLQIIQTLQRAVVMPQTAFKECRQFLAAEHLAGHAFVLGTALGKVFQQFQFQVIACQDQRAIAAHMKARLCRQIQPQTSALACQFHHDARRLTGHQYLTKITYGGALGLVAALEHSHAKLAAGSRPGMCHAQDAAPHHDDIVVLCAHYFLASDLPS